MSTASADELIATMERLLSRGAANKKVSKTLAQQLQDCLVQLQEHLHRQQPKKSIRRAAPIPSVQQTVSTPSVSVPAIAAPTPLDHLSEPERHVLEYLRHADHPVKGVDIAHDASLSLETVTRALRELRAQHLVGAVAIPEGGIAYQVKVPA